MADYLASIYGTEKDKVNCSFYFKIGACRHGERCSRKHIKPSFSQTLLLSNLYRNPSHDPTANMSPEQLQEDFDLFFEDVFMELAKFGEIEEMVVCDNVGDHLVGNVYVQYHYEEQAGNAVEDLNKRFYAGRPLYAELSPVTDFREACCRQHEISECNRGGFCNFMHLKHPRRALRRELFEAQRLSVKEKKREERHAEDKRRERSASPRHHKEERRTEREDDGYQHAPSDFDNGDTKRSRTEDSHEYRS